MKILRKVILCFVVIAEVLTVMQPFSVYAKTKVKEKENENGSAIRKELEEVDVYYAS